MGVSFIIPCHNEEKIIISKINNTLFLGNLVNEIIVIDDYSLDKTFEIVKRFSLKNRRVKIFKNVGRGKNSAVILGLDKSKSEIICMTDADVMLSKNVLQKVLSYFENPNVGMVSLSTKLLGENHSYSFIYENLVRFIKIL